MNGLVSVAHLDRQISYWLFIHFLMLSRICILNQNVGWKTEVTIVSYRLSRISACDAEMHTHSFVALE